jgi:hypothetical protein
MTDCDEKSQEPRIEGLAFFGFHKSQNHKIRNGVVKRWPLMVLSVERKKEKDDEKKSFVRGYRSSSPIKCK